MEIHDETSETTRYIQEHHGQRLEDKENSYRNYIRQIERFRKLDSNTRILEIGTGTGWFPILCKLRGLNCTGLEISPQLISYAYELGAAYDVVPNILLGNIEDASLSPASYDVIVAMSVFEHVEFWRQGLRRVHEVLRPGGLLLFESTNKFSLTSGEYEFPLYGWLPDRWRYRLRIARQSPDIMLLGIDFNQFRYPMLRRAFAEAGFTEIYDRFQIADPTTMQGWKSRVVHACQTNAILRQAILSFVPTTNFVCIK